MESEELMVTIPISRYEQLLDAETRIDVAVDQMVNSDYFKEETVLRILGTLRAIQKADEIREKNIRIAEEYSRKYEEQEGVKNETDRRKC